MNAKRVASVVLALLFASAALPATVVASRPIARHVRTDHTSTASVHNSSSATVRQPMRRERTNDKAAGTVNIKGTWNCCGAGGAGAQVWKITSGSGSIAGVGYVPNSDQVFATISGDVSGDRVTIITTYNSYAPGYVATFKGLITGDGNTMLGTWTSNWHQSGSWTATRAPTLKVTGVTPNHGPIIGGNVVTVHGTGLTGVDGVCFKIPRLISCLAPQSGGTDTALKVKVPDLELDRNLAVADIRVDLNHGTSKQVESPVTPADRYTFELKVTGVSPNVGPFAGENVVTVHGVGLTGVDEICFAAGCAKPEAGGSDNEVKIRVPQHPFANANPDSVHVVAWFYLKSGRVGSPYTPADRYSYELKVTGVSLNTGPIYGGNFVTVHGVGLTGVDHMCFDGRTESDCEAVNEHSGTDTALRVKVYHSYGVAENPDVVDVRVYVNFAKPGTIESRETPADRYTYEFKITRVSPNHGARDGGNVVNVYGVGLKQVDGVALTVLVVASAPVRNRAAPIHI